ncbi:MAG TPA: peptidyl-tRNA hydrolase Pth2 [Candidatus Bathyarchaeia archaeon]|nr:peptidyl-tRNA hydrolase Pth2 [Candidatus Bathyarchaeia archaeon]
MKLKQAIIVRTDLSMGKGKIAGQVAHAAVEAAESIRRYCPEWYYSWLDDDSLETKIILKVDSEAKLHALSRDAFAQGINPAKIYDAGKTQLEPSTFTAVGIGPAPEYKIDLLIKDLKLL